MDTPSNPWLRLLRPMLLVLAAGLFVLHYVHLAADFPNHSEWMDWSKYTDEGWYGDAAIRHFQRGHWFVDGDFNPAAALPVWPFLEAILFRFTGVSLVAARALTVTVFGDILLTSWRLIRRWPGSARASRQSYAAEAGVLLLVVNPLCYVITRLAILEPLLILLTLCALLTVSRMRAAAADTSWRSLRNRAVWMDDLRANRLPVITLAVLLPAMILTKTTGLFLVPAIAFLLWAAVGYRLTTLLRLGLAASAAGVTLWLAYFALLIRPHFLLDYRYLFSANAYTGITLDTAGQVFADTFTDGKWMGPTLFGVAVACIALALFSFTRLRRNPLVVTLLLWSLGYAAFLAYHANLQPRYYLVVTVPLTLLVPVALEQLLVFQFTRPKVRHFVRFAVAALLVGIAVPQAREVVYFVRHPQYTLVTAAHEVYDYIAHDRASDPGHNPLVLSISGSDLSLMTGLPSICDDFGTLELEDRIAKYRPGWYAAWNAIEDDKMDALTPYVHVERVAEFPAMDDPDRDVLILYKLTDASKPTPRRRRGKLPRTPLRTKVGEQPSVRQLEH